MSDLIAIGRSGVLAYRDALAGVSENVVNANNDGFARREVTLKEQTTSGGPMFLYRSAASFNGVQPTDVTRVWDQYRAANAWSANSDNARASTRSQYLQTIESTLDDSDSGIGTKLTAVFTSASALAANPEDTTLRQGMLYALGDAAGALGQADANLGKVSDTIGQQASVMVDQLNSALGSLARINISLKSSPVGTSGRAALEDQRDNLIGTISGSVGVDVTLDQYGAATLKLNDYGGPALLSGTDNVPAMVNLQRASDGRLAMTLTSGGTPSGATPTSGALSGFADAASLIADRRRQLDGLASSLADTVNTWQANGFTADGSAGQPLLTGTTAQGLALATNDPAAIAAADATTANGNLLALNTLRGSGGVEASWHSIVTDQALQVASAKTEATTASTQKDSAYTALDQVSGVDLDAEAADLMRYQQAYSASAKIIQTARETLQAVLDLF